MKLLGFLTGQRLASLGHWSISILSGVPLFALALALSVGIGLALGLLGGGGSILTIPILKYVLHLETRASIAISLFVVATTSVTALVPHARRGNVRWKTGVVFGAAGMAGAFVGGRLAHFVPGPVLLVGFGVVMFAAAFAMMKKRPETPVSGAKSPLGAAAIVALGSAVGLVTGLVGAGGGFLIVPALVLLGGVPMEVAVGTSLFVIGLQSSAGLVGYLGHTAIDWRIAGGVAAAAMCGSIAGSMLSPRISPERLRKGFAWFVLAMATFLLAQELPSLFHDTLSR